MEENLSQLKPVQPKKNLEKLTPIFIVVGILIAGYFVAAKSQSWWPFVSEDEKEGEICIQVITPARNLKTGEVRDFPTPCDVPKGWEIIPPSDMINENMEQKWTEEQQKAISIAQAELFRMFPDGSFGREYGVRDVSLAHEGSNARTVWFSLGASHPTDTDVYITVDTEKEKIISVRKPGA